MNISSKIIILQVEIWKWLQPNFMNIRLTPTEAIEDLDDQEILIDKNFLSMLANKGIEVFAGVNIVLSSSEVWHIADLHMVTIVS